MKYSKLFGKTVRQPKKEMSAISHKLLYQGGFIRESTSGRYYFLPLGMRVRNKIIELIRQEMDKTGAQEMITPVLHPLELWQETNRTNEAGFELTKVTDRRGADFALGGTAEEMMIALVRDFKLSYKDLPFNIYQFSQKFRDELRARGGLLRTREFMMKDAYSFHSDEKDFEKEYETMAQTYTKIFERCGLKTTKVLADNGYIGGDYCHEYIVDSAVGESTYLTSENGDYVAHEDVAKFKREEINLEEEQKPLETIEQPEWVQTMEQNEEHYKLPASRFLKNVVYKNRVTKEIIVAVIRGDLDVNKTKLEQVLSAVGQLEDATEEDLQKIGTKTGYVHSWGNEKVKYVGDISLKTVSNFIGGQKEKTTDTINVNYGRDFECEILDDIALAKDGHLTEDGNQKLIVKKGIEVGNIFQLGHHYTTKMANATFVNANNGNEPFYMGCYGIGIGRTLATVVEKHHDENGIIWPWEVAPYKIHLISLNLENAEVAKQTEKIFATLTEKGIEVLFDDRTDTNAGEKFADADLLGIPFRAVVSARTEGKIEIKERADSETKPNLIDLDTLIQIGLTGKL
jgi:prolyl-tRNA synthetase